jgi:hypothetical protein
MRALRTGGFTPVAVKVKQSHYMPGQLEVDVVGREMQRFAQKHEERLHQHENVEAIKLLDNTGIVRRLQRKKPYDLV